MCLVEVLKSMFDKKQNLCRRENNLSYERNKPYQSKMQSDYESETDKKNKRLEIEDKLYQSLNQEQRKMFDDVVHMIYAEFDKREDSLIDFVFDFAKHLFK